MWIKILFVWLNRCCLIDFHTYISTNFKMFWIFVTIGIFMWRRICFVWIFRTVFSIHRVILLHFKKWIVFKLEFTGLITFFHLLGYYRRIRWLLFLFRNPSKWYDAVSDIDINLTIFILTLFTLDRFFSTLAIQQRLLFIYFLKFTFHSTQCVKYWRIWFLILQYFIRYVILALWTSKCSQFQ